MGCVSRPARKLLGFRSPRQPVTSSAARAIEFAKPRWDLDQASRSIMRKTIAVLSLALLRAGGCTNYYKVHDPTTGRDYYTTELSHQNNGAATLKIRRTGNRVNVQNWEILQDLEGGIRVRQERRAAAAAHASGSRAASGPSGRARTGGGRRQPVQVTVARHIGGGVGAWSIELLRVENQPRPASWSVPAEAWSEGLRAKPSAASSATGYAARCARPRAARRACHGHVDAVAATTRGAGTPA